ncbi:MAG TPA: DUF4279 domain-containing protein [Candidatus Baltobacteraceae bacterium]|jgi:hypothetical protein|nr:DUF4279 domain-containing protein [Candidatus Baltobacteraceae bacterium]
MKRTTAQMHNQSAAHFTVVSGEIDPEEMCEHLGIKCDSTVLKDTPNPSTPRQRHPFNMVIFRSHLSDSVDIEKHVEDLLSRILPIRSRIRNLPKNCAACFHFNYMMRRSGGWSLSPSLVRRLARLGVECLFSLDLGHVMTGTRRHYALERVNPERKNKKHGRRKRVTR